MAQLRILTTAQSSAWLDVLDHCSAYDFYHLPGYHALAEQQGEGTAQLFVWSEGGCTIALPLLLRSLENLPGVNGLGADWSDATSVYGYAGPVASTEVVAQDVRARFQNALCEALRAQRVVCVFSRLHPLLSGQAYLLAGLGECKTLAQTVSLDLTLPPAVQRSHFRRNHREGIGKLRRRGIASFHDPACAQLGEFLDLYYETMRRVGAASAYFYPAPYFEGLHACLGPRLHLFGCRIEEQLACGGLFVECNGIMQFHLGGTRDAFLHLALMKLLFDDVREWASAHGLRVLHLGGGATSRPDDSLLHFKSGFSRRTHDFCVWRYTTAGDTYEQLCRDVTRWNEQQRLRSTNPDYFPAYRCPTEPLTPTPVDPVAV
jgi:hypothetical protein